MIPSSRGKGKQKHDESWAQSESFCLGGIYIHSTHISLTKANHVATPEINRVGVYYAGGISIVQHIGSWTEPLSLCYRVSRNLAQVEALNTIYLVITTQTFNHNSIKHSTFCLINDTVTHLQCVRHCSRLIEHDLVPALMQLIF